MTMDNDFFQDMMTIFEKCAGPFHLISQPSAYAAIIEAIFGALYLY